MDEDILKQDKILLEPETTAPATDAVTGDSVERPPKKLYHPVKTLEERKQEKAARRARDARLIVRNLSFKCTEENLREHFAQFGPLVDLNVLKRSDGKLVGCAFVQYEKVTQAAKAISHCSGKDLHGRTVYVDFAVNKKEHDRHERANKNKPKATAATGAAAAAPPTTVERNPEDESDDDDADGQQSIKSEQESDVDEDDADEDDADEDDDVDDKTDIKPRIKSEDGDSDTDSLPAKRKQSGKDVLAEGCTVFIRNIPFDATERDFAQCARQFGHIHYARITMDAKSGHSKGTGFVKFRTPESADMCLQAGTEFRLFDQVLDPMPFCTKDAIAKRNAEKTTKTAADSRNLYLRKEGMITAGSPAAEGVSTGDMAKRLQLERTMSQMLDDLTKFVSRERLIVHNIPGTYDSAKLATAVRQHAKVKPKNCRVQRENHPSVGHPQGASKGFGFVEFEKHEDALLCLRRLNNNPAVFGKNNRPIVSFALEKQTAHKVKEKRLQRSIEKNPNLLAKKERRLERRKLARQQKMAILNGTAMPTNGTAMPTNGTAKATNGKTASTATNLDATLASTTDGDADDADDTKPQGKSMRRKLRKAKLKLLNRQQKLAKIEAKKAAAAAAAGNGGGNDASAEQSFAGVLAEPGTGSKRPRWKLVQQSQAHVADVAVQKRDARKEREKRALQQEKKEVDRTKKRQRSGNEVDSFSFMVDKYKQLIDSSNAADGGDADGAPAATKRTKWYAE